MKWKHGKLCYFIFFGLFFIFSFFLSPTRVNAESLTGAWTMYVQNSNGNNLPQNYSSTIPGITFPSSSYTQLSGSTVNQNPYIFTVVTRVDLQPSYTYVKGNYYTITVNFETGSYIIPYFPTNSSNWFVSQCTNSLCNTTPSVTYNFIIDSTHQGTNTLQVVIKFTATANTSNSTILLGNLTDAKGNFYNQYSGQQGLRISSATIDYVDNSVDFTPVIESNEQNTQNIINNNNQNTQTIINNQNQNTQQQIESQQVCKILDYTQDTVPKDDRKVLSVSTGVVTDNQYFNTTKFLSVYKGNVLYTQQQSNYVGVYCLYNTSEELINCNNNLSTSNTIVINEDGFIKISFFRNNNNITIYGKMCKNGNQALSDDINDLNNNITDTDVTGVDDGLDNIDEISDTPISDLLTLPLTLLQTIYTGMSGTCSNFSMEFGLWGGSYSLSLPCLNLGHEKYFGRLVWGVIDDLFCIFMFLNIFKMVIYFYESWSTLTDNFMYILDPSNRGGLF